MGDGLKKLCKSLGGLSVKDKNGNVTKFTKCGKIRKIKQRGMEQSGSLISCRS